MSVDTTYMGSAVIPYENTLYLLRQELLIEVDPITHEIKRKIPLTKPCTYIWLKDYAAVEGNKISFLNDDGYILEFDIPRQDTTVVNVNQKNRITTTTEINLEIE